MSKAKVRAKAVTITAKIIKISVNRIARKNSRIGDVYKRQF